MKKTLILFFLCCIGLSISACGDSATDPTSNNHEAATWNQSNWDQARWQ